MTDPHKQNEKDKFAEDKANKARLQQQAAGSSSKAGKSGEQLSFDFMQEKNEPPIQPGDHGQVQIHTPIDTPWQPKSEGALHPDIVKKEANLALHALRPQPRFNEIEIVLQVMFHDAFDHEQEFTEVDAIRTAAVAKFKELFPLTVSAQEGAPSAASGAIVT